MRGWRKPASQLSQALGEVADTVYSLAWVKTMSATAVSWAQGQTVIAQLTSSERGPGRQSSGPITDTLVSSRVLDQLAPGTGPDDPDKILHTSSFGTSLATYTRPTKWTREEAGGNQRLWFASYAGGFGAAMYRRPANMAFDSATLLSADVASAGADVWADASWPAGSPFSPDDWQFLEFVVHLALGVADGDTPGRIAVLVPASTFTCLPANDDTGVFDGGAFLVAADGGVQTYLARSESGVRFATDYGNAADPLTVYGHRWLP